MQDGNLRFLQVAKASCDWLLVGVGGDTICSKSKGKHPVIQQEHRVEMVRNLKCVDDACIFDVGLDNTQESLSWILSWKVDVMFVGEEWKNTPRWHRLSSALEPYGVAVVWLPRTPNISSTLIQARVLGRK